jgi:uncharacterized protein YidB (DUF937 family)/transcriptional regulator with XRE-family HTH domain
MELGNPGAISGPLALFCGRLRRLQMASGISQSRLLSAAHLGRSQMSDILNGKIKRLPDWDVTISIVRACLEHAEADSRPVPPDLRGEGDWRRRYADLEHDLDAESRQGPRNEMLPGRLLAQVTDPFVLEVHRPVQPDTPQPGLPALPAYVPREHDAELERVVTAAAQGDSGIAVLVGGSSTGKTRACWEALGRLRDQVKPWRLWHPIDPSRPEAALRELHSIGPRTVIWLNEAQFYLDASGGLGERVAAGLRELLRDPAKAPVLVLATLWPRFWNQLTARPTFGTDDPHAQARELLAGRDITVPAAFAEASLRQLDGAADPRLVQAARAAEGGQVIQVLAGAPELLARYRNAPPAAAALISAAMDARRLGIRVALPLAFLEAAAPGYLTDPDWDGLGEDWLEQALAYTAVPCKGVRGPLTRIRSRPARSRPPRPGPRDRDAQLAGDRVSIASMPLYRLADYLDQHGRRDRNDQIPPADFWAAATDHALPDDQAALGDAAHDRGLYRYAAQLHKNAAAGGNLHAISYLSNPPDLLRLDGRPIRWAIDHAPLDTSGAVANLLHSLQETGAQDQVAALLARDPAAQIPLDHARDVAQLLDWLREAGAQDQVAALLARDPAAHASLDDPVAVATLLASLRETGAQDQVAALLARDPAARIPLGYPIPVAMLLDRLREAGAQDQVAALAARAAAHASLPDLRAVTTLLDRLRVAGMQDQVAVLAARAAACVPLDDPGGVAWLLDRLVEAGAQDQVATLLARDPAAHVPLDDPDAVAWLLHSLREAGAQDQVATLLARDHAAHVPSKYPEAVTRVLQNLLEADTQDQVAALAHDLPAYVDLNHPGNVAWLLDTLREAGAQDQVAVLARDLAPQVLLDHSPYVGILLASLREAGAQEQATALLGRLPAAGMFELFRQQEDHQDRFRFGREADGTPAEPWGWEDLD